jgi:DNA-binding MarR family transcriptional regulator
MDSDSTKRWSIDEAEDTVKAVFLINAKDEDQLPKLRYTDIMIAISAQGRPISPKMLTEALGSLVDKGQMTFERSELDLREKLYSLVPLKREQVVQLMSSMDMARISKGKGIGAIADPDEGWSYYSVPVNVKNRVRPRLRAEAKAFRKKVIAILDDEMDLFLDDLEHRVRGRLPKRQVREGLEACALILISAEEVGKAESLLLSVEKVIQEFMPGSVKMLESIGRTVVDTERALLTTMFGLTNKEYDEAMKLREDTYNKVRTIFDKLSTRDKGRFSERLTSLMVLRSSLSAVVHL